MDDMGYFPVFFPTSRIPCDAGRHSTVLVVITGVTLHSLHRL